MKGAKAELRGDLVEHFGPVEKRYRKPYHRRDDEVEQKAPRPTVQRDPIWRAEYRGGDCIVSNRYQRIAKQALPHLAVCAASEPASYPKDDDARREYARERVDFFG